MLKLLVYGVLNVLSMLVGRIWAGIAACVNAPKGPQKKNPAALPTATLAASAYCCGLRPDNVWMFEILITALAGITAWPAATTRFRRSNPMNSCGMPPAKEAGQAKLPAVLWESERF